MSKVMTNHKENKINKPKRTSPRTSIEGSDQVFSYRAIPITSSMINKYVDLLRKWVIDNPNAKFINAFFPTVGLTHGGYYKLVANHPNLKEAHQDAMREIGQRMYSNAVDGKVNWPAVRHRLWSYSDDFKKDEEYHSQLKANEKGNTDAPQVQYIVVDSKFDSNTDMKEISDEKENV